MFDTIPTGALIRLTRPTEYVAESRSGSITRTPLAAGTLGEVLYAMAGGYVCRLDGAGDKFILRSGLTEA